MLIYHVNWRSTYFDLLAFSLSTIDPFVHPVTCILVSQRYRAGYKAALKHIISILGSRTKNRNGESKVQEFPVPEAFRKSTVLRKTTGNGGFDEFNVSSPL